MTTKSTELIEAEPFTTGKPDSILAGVWRQILKDLQIDNSMLYEKISMYADRLKQVPLKRRIQIRGNMRTDAFKENLTWYTFTKNLRALSADQITMVFDCQHIRRKSTHEFVVILNDDFATKKDSDDPDPNVPSPLSAFFAKVIHDLEVDYKMFELLLELYMRRTMMDQSAQSKNDLRAYVRKEFRSNKMSWNSLIKGLSFLCILDVKLKVTLHNSFGYNTEHKYHFMLGDIDSFKEERLNGNGI